MSDWERVWNLMNAVRGLGDGGLSVERDGMCLVSRRGRRAIEVESTRAADGDLQAGRLRVTVTDEGVVRGSFELLRDGRSSAPLIKVVVDEGPTALGDTVLSLVEEGEQRRRLKAFLRSHDWIELAESPASPPDGGR